MGVKILVGREPSLGPEGRALPPRQRRPRKKRHKPGRVRPIQARRSLARRVGVGGGLDGGPGGGPGGGADGREAGGREGGELELGRQPGPRPRCRLNRRPGLRGGALVRRRLWGHGGAGVPGALEEDPGAGREGGRALDAVQMHVQPAARAHAAQVRALAQGSGWDRLTAAAAAAAGRREARNRPGHKRRGHKRTGGRGRKRGRARGCLKSGVARNAREGSRHPAPGVPFFVTPGRRRRCWGG
mmetsp:Transcript_13640/g.32298  ORF Transcript_13640/g.32298 Transcript_13640/m.32298 type:complete len:243 (+) Transcript_13640:159-887(+)